MIELPHVQVPMEGCELENWTADINDDKPCQCHWCDVCFIPQFVMQNSTHRFYVAVDGTHLHIEIGGEVQI